MGGFSLLRGTPGGSPFDPTVSIVIPIGMGIAIRVWRKSKIEIKAMRMRLGLWIAATALVASVACSSLEAQQGITAIGVDSDGKPVAELRSGSIYAHFRFLEVNGESKWSLGDHPEPERLIDWGESTVLTPRGEYSVVGSNIIFKGESKPEVVYLSNLPSNRSHEFFHYKATDILVEDQVGGNNLFAVQPSIIYAEPTETVIAANGVQGIVVGTPDGRWELVGVDRFVPIDVSYADKLAALFEETTLLAISLVVGATACVSVFASLHRQVNRRVTIFTLIACVAVIAVICVPAFQYFEGYTLTGPVLLVVQAVLFIVGLSGIALAFSDTTKSPQTRIVLGGILAALSLANSLMFVGWVFVGPRGEFQFISELPLFFALPIAGAIVATVIARPTIQQLPFYLFAAVLMAGLFVFPFVMWIDDSIDIARAKLSGLGLVLAVALVLFFVMKRGQRTMDTIDPRTEDLEQ